MGDGACSLPAHIEAGHVVIAAIGAMSAVITAFLSNRNHRELRTIKAAVNGHGGPEDT